MRQKAFVVPDSRATAAEMDATDFIVEVASVFVGDSVTVFVCVDCACDRYCGRRMVFAVGVDECFLAAGTSNMEAR
jgi:hypothetical protein